MPPMSQQPGCRHLAVGMERLAFSRHLLAVFRKGTPQRIREPLVLQAPGGGDGVVDVQQVQVLEAPQPDQLHVTER